jgi:hypothetical protein
MTTATVTPSWRVTRSSRDTAPEAGRDGPDVGMSGRRAGLAGLVPLPSGRGRGCITGPPSLRGGPTLGGAGAGGW